MMWLKIVWSKITHKKLNSLLCVVLMAFGISIISLLGHLQGQLEKNFTSNIRGIDMVVGAKGSPLQLILSSVFQIDNPTGNIPLQSVNNLKKNPLIKSVIPLSMGDNYKGYRIVGSTSQYLEHFEAKVQSGNVFEKNYQVVIGSDVARNLNLNLGDTFESTHGLDSEGEGHHHDPFEIVGILAKNNSPLDKLVICNLGSIWDVHHMHDEDENLSVTSALVKFRSPMGLMTIPRSVNENTVMQAALPSIEIDRLLQLFDQGIQFAEILAYLIIFISAFSVFIAIYNTIKEGRNEMALMLSMGATRVQLFFQFLTQGVILGGLGYILGILLSKTLIAMSNNYLNETINTQVNFLKIESFEIYLFGLALIISVIAAVIPALSVYNLNLSKTLKSD